MCVCVSVRVCVVCVCVCGLFGLDTNMKETYNVKESSLVRELHKNP